MFADSELVDKTSYKKNSAMSTEKQ